jgi:hypothetical protein
MMKDLENKLENGLFKDLSKIIETGKKQLTAQVNSTLTIVYWKVGSEINKHVLEKKRADYAKEIVPTLSTQLVTQYGKSFELRNL